MVYWYSTPDDVKPEFGAWSNRVAWCEKNCKGSWDYKLRGQFKFYNKEDYIMFLLRWS